VRNGVYALLFLTLTAEAFDAYGGEWETFMKDVGDLMFPPSFLKIPLLDLTVILMLLFARSRPGAQTMRAKPMDQAVVGSLFAVGAWLVFGALRGGDTHSAIYQLKPVVTAWLFSLLLTAVLRSPSDFEGLGKVIVASAVYRASMGIYFWMNIAPTLKNYPATMTTHGDTVLFVMAIVVVVANALEVRSKKAVFAAISVIAFMLFMIQINNRRLAWVSLVGSLIALYANLPKGRLKKRVNRGILLAIPILAIYIAAGWNSGSLMFKPVRSFRTIGGEKEDSSTKARNNENASLIVTYGKQWLLGSGWGHEYTEVDATMSVADIFPLYHFIPHNSVLAILAFTGFVGFFAHWLPFPVSAYLNARTYRASRSPIERAASSAALAQIVVCTNQIYGDMGYVSTTGLYIAATGFAVAGRLSISSGGWYDGMGATRKA
jgi:hypothetical protein